MGGSDSTFRLWTENVGFLIKIRGIEWEWRQSSTQTFEPGKELSTRTNTTKEQPILFKYRRPSSSLQASRTHGKDWKGWLKQNNHSRSFGVKPKHRISSHDWTLSNFHPKNVCFGDLAQWSIELSKAVNCQRWMWKFWIVWYLSAQNWNNKMHMINDKSVSRIVLLTALTCWSVLETNSTMLWGYLKNTSSFNCNEVHQTKSTNALFVVNREKRQDAPYRCLMSGIFLLDSVRNQNLSWPIILFKTAVCCDIWFLRWIEEIDGSKVWRSLSKHPRMNTLNGNYLNLNETKWVWRHVRKGPVFDKQNSWEMITTRSLPIGRITEMFERKCASALVRKWEITTNGRVGCWMRNGASWWKTWRYWKVRITEPQKKRADDSSFMITSHMHDVRMGFGSPFQRPNQRIGYYHSQYSMESTKMNDASEEKRANQTKRP